MLPFNPEQTSSLPAFKADNDTAVSRVRKVPYDQLDDRAPRDYSILEAKDGFDLRAFADAFIEDVSSRGHEYDNTKVAGFQNSNLEDLAVKLAKPEQISLLRMILSGLAKNRNWEGFSNALPELLQLNPFLTVVARDMKSDPNFKEMVGSMIAESATHNNVAISATEAVYNELPDDKQKAFMALAQLSKPFYRLEVTVTPLQDDTEKI